MFVFGQFLQKKRFIHLTKIGFKKNLPKDLEIKKIKSSLKDLRHIFLIMFLFEILFLH